jgi:hypothetical protein
VKLPACCYLSRRPKPSDDPEYLAFIRLLPCLICGKKAEPHHAGQRGIGQKADDRTAIPLCQKHHRRPGLGGASDSAHALGKRFWQHHGIDRAEVIQRYNRAYEELQHQEAA